MIKINSIVSLRPIMKKFAVGFDASEVFKIVEIYKGYIPLCTIRNKWRWVINVPVNFWKKTSPKKLQI